MGFPCTSVLVVSLLLATGTLGYSAEPDRTEEAAIAEIERLGGKCEGSPVVKVDLSGTQVTDAELVHLKGLTGLQELNLRGTRITTAGMEHLKELPPLRELDLIDAPVSKRAAKQMSAVAAIRKLGGIVYYDYQLDAEGHPISNAEPPGTGWLRELAGTNFLSDVVWVRLVSTQMTDAGLVHLKGLSRLERLELGGKKVTDAGLVHLKGLTELEQLSLHNTQVTDSGLVHLKGLTKLKDLNLSRTEVTDSGLVHLEELPKLEYLWLDDTQVSDAGLVHLKGLTKLEGLDLRDTQVSDEGVEKLQRELPDCAILYMSYVPVIITLPDCEIRIR